MNETTIDKHSVNCYFCGRLVDERECMSADEYNNDDGGDICPDCQKTQTKNCGHKSNEDCMFCADCGECSEELDEDDICPDCR